jgi:predicted phosphodiesterase
MSGEQARLALLGGTYNNYLALAAALRDATDRGVDAIYCLGDLGAFGPHPDRVFPLLEQYNVQCLQGNYDHSIGHELDDCRCGYTDPRDNHFAQISYDYTLAHTSADHRRYLRNLPPEIRLEIAGRRLLLCHGSPRRTNEFLWESTTSTHFLEWLLTEYQADVVAATHTGLKWQRAVAPDRLYVNVGVLGRPENDGRSDVWYTLLHVKNRQVRAEFVPVAYDFRRLAREMREERLPEEFVETIVSGWWTTCLEVLPGKERRRGRF